MSVGEDVTEGSEDTEGRPSLEGVDMVLGVWLDHLGRRRGRIAVDEGCASGGATRVCLVRSRGR